MTTLAKSTSATSTLASEFGIGGEVKQFPWHYREDLTVSVVYEILGQGAPVLLLPAFSTVSTRAEMRPLAEILAPKFQVIALDWPGFGQSERPPLNYQPALYHQFLAEFVKGLFNTPIAVVTAGHAAGYVMQLAKTERIWSKIALVAPTWRGPLPTMMGERKQWFSLLNQIVRSPILGQILYQLNTTPGFLSSMYRSHVYINSDRVTSNFIQHKRQITQQAGARFGPAAFVTGALDPVQHQSEFLSWFEFLSVPVMVVIGAQVPPKSRTEMDAIAALPGVQSQVIPGSLGLHEEYATELAKVVLPFLEA